MDLMKTLMVYFLLLTAGAASGAVEALPAAPTKAPAATPYMTQTPAVAETPAPILTALRVGDRGDDVLQLQTLLKDMGYLSGALDGIYGQDTKAAVEKFQTEHALTVDGFAGPKTLAALNEAAMPTAAPTDVPSAVPSEAPAETPTGSSVPAPTKTPEATAAPTAAPSAVPTPTQAPATPEPTAAPSAVPTIPIRVEYIEQQTGEILYQTEMSLEGTATVYADNKNVQGAYKLCSPGAVTVNIRNGAATPEAVTFYYIPDTVSYTVICTDDIGTVLHAESVTLNKGESAVIAPQWDARKEGWQIKGESSVSVTAETKDGETPKTIVFTYEKTASALNSVPHDSLLPEGTAVCLNGESYPMPWYIDQAGTPFLCLNRLCDAAGIERQDQGYLINGREVILITDGADLVSLTVQDASMAENVLLWENSLYVDQMFLEALGFTVSAEGSTLLLTAEE